MERKIEAIFEQAVEKDVSDIFIIAGREVTFKIQGIIHSQGEEKLTSEDTKRMIEAIYHLSDRSMQLLLDKGDDDFAFGLEGIGRFRINTYKQRGSLAAVIRIVKFELPDKEVLQIPEQVLDLYKLNKGLVLVTGPAGSGKSTTLSCILDGINTNKKGHIITLEEPIEFLYRHKESIVSQREVGIDTETYVTGLRAALREMPDVILLGEMRDLETISITMTAAETGQLVLATLHTVGASNTIDRIIDIFPPEQQHQVRVQLAMVLKAVVSQQLIVTEEGIVPIFEIMFVNQAIRNLIREGKIHQIDGMIANATHEGMRTMNMSLLEKYKTGEISKEQVLSYTLTPESIIDRLV